MGYMVELVGVPAFLAILSFAGPLWLKSVEWQKTADILAVLCLAAWLPAIGFILVLAAI
jgi:hypothetical protein